MVKYLLSITVNLILLFLYLNLGYIFVCILRLLLLLMTMFVCYFVSANEFSEGIMCVSTCAGYFVHLAATKSSTIHID